MTVRLRNLSKPINKFVYRISYFVYREEGRKGEIKQRLKFRSRSVSLYVHRKPCLSDSHLTGQTKENKIGRAQFIVPLHLNLIFFHSILDTNCYSLTTNLIGELTNVLRYSNSIQGPKNYPGFAYHILTRDKSPISAITTIGSIIS